MSDQVGPTGKFPQGKLTEDDEGELAVGIGIVNGAVVIRFGTPVKWFGMPPNMARQMAAALFEHADQIDKEKAGGDNGKEKSES